MHTIRVVLTAAWFMLAATGYAYADPITTALFGAAFASTFAGSVVTLGITTALTFGANWAMSLLQKGKESTEAPQGFQLEAQVGDAVPLSFHVGRAATGGTRKYIGSWGNDGEVPNAYLTDVFQIGDLPGRGLDGFWEDSSKRTVLWNEANDIGAPVLERRINGKDHQWVRYRSGFETAPDALLTAKFGASERPWSNDMIGRGCEGVIVTTLVNRELFQAQPAFLFEPAPQAWYDLRKDSTNGGFGAHRWNDQATWEPTQNAVVIIYNIIRGIYYGDEWVYGGQNLPAFRLPASSWMAAANECDVAIPLASGETEPQYRCGAEIQGDIEPLDQIQELLVACNGRLAEVGGMFEILVGAPGAAVFSFTDDDIRITTSQGLTPFPSLQSTHNGIEATYPEPAEMWASKDAPARYSDVLELQDGDRRLITGVNYAAVPFGTQAQRLMKSGIEEDRRFRIHEFALGPEAWPLTPNTVVSYSSERNGYVNKKFLIARKSGEPGMMQNVVLREIDPTDYSWSSGDQLPSVVGPLGPLLPPPMPMYGWQVAPTTIDGVRPSMEVFYSGNQSDTRAVSVQVRKPGENGLIFEGDLPYAAPEPEQRSTVLNGIFKKLTDYEVRGKYLPFSGAPREWSSWLPVTTPDVGIGLSEIDAEFGAVLGIITGMGEGSLSERLQELYDKLAQLAATEITAGVVAYTERRELEATQNDDRAYFLQQITVLVNADQALATMITVLETEFNENVAFVAQQLTALSTADSALAELIEQVEVEVDGVTAGGIFKMQASAGPSGWSTKISAIVRASANGTFYEAGWYTLVNSNGDNVFAVKANDFYFLNDSGGVITSPFYITGGTVYIKNAVIQDLTIGNRKIEHGAVTGLWAVSADDQIDVAPGGTALLNQIYIEAEGDALVITAASHTESTGSATSRGTLELRKNGATVAATTFACDDVPTTYNQINYVEQNPGPATYQLWAVVQGGGGIGGLDGMRFRRRFISVHNGKR